jgi:thioredoxin reductase (NADPH)
MRKPAALSPMSEVTIVDGGSAELCTALFTAKNGLDTAVFDTDKTWMHKAHLFNYLGIESIDGTEYMEKAREQADKYGVTQHVETAVTNIEQDDDGFQITTDDGDHYATYVVLTTGADRDSAKQLGCEFIDSGTVSVI